MKCGKVKRRNQRTNANANAKKRKCWLLKWAKASERKKGQKKAEVRRMESANLLKTSQVFSILKMSHCTIPSIHSSNADAIRLNDAAESNWNCGSRFIKIPARCSGFGDAFGCTLNNIQCTTGPSCYSFGWAKSLIVHSILIRFGSVRFISFVFSMFFQFHRQPATMLIQIFGIFTQLFVFSVCQSSEE